MIEWVTSWAAPSLRTRPANGLHLRVLQVPSRSHRSGHRTHLLIPARRRRCHPERLQLASRVRVDAEVEQQVRWATAMGFSASGSPLLLQMTRFSDNAPTRRAPGKATSVWSPLGNLRNLTNFTLNEDLFAFNPLTPIRDFKPSAADLGSCAPSMQRVVGYDGDHLSLILMIRG
ncbi:hypothetical protein GQ600_10692 [Phytophthora cactorum]|nr:hypothetical protein GQ600_10692 [Phytophthora cactorum]